MLTQQELHEEIHTITEISNVFLYLIENREMCNSQITCDLFFDYANRVKSHLDIYDTTIYALILRNGDTNARDTAENFLSGSIELKRIFQSYLKKWSKKGGHKLIITNHSVFVNETKEIFGLVLNRVQHETEQLYPLVKLITDDLQKVA